MNLRLKRSMVFLVFMVLLCGSIPSAGAFEPSPDPLGNLWKSTIVPKDRAIVTYMDPGRNMVTFRGQNVEVESALSGYFKNETSFGTKPSSMGGLSGADGSRPYVMTSTPGTVLRDITVGHQFYGENTFQNVPVGVLCNAYLTMRDADGVDTSIFVELTDASGRIGRAELKSAPKPSYKYEFEADTIKILGPELDRNVASDIVAFDWNGDGFSDYVLSYVHNPKGNNKYAEDMRIALLYIDGKSLHDHIVSGGASAVRFSADTSIVCSTKKSVVGGRTDVKPANSVRMAAGDVDGDGMHEIALVHTKTGDGRGDNGLYVFDVSWNGSTAAFSRLFSADEGVGNSYLQNDSVGVAIGNIDGDATGTGEVCVIYGETDLLYQKSTIYLDIYQYGHDDGNNKLRKIAGPASLAKTYNVLGQRDKASIPPIEVAAADLDGDGKAELAWLNIDENNENKLALFVHKWSGESVTNEGTVARSNVSDLANWRLDGKFARYSMTTGVFNYPDDDAQVNIPRHIAIALMGDASAGGGARNLHWGIFTWKQSSGLAIAGTGLAQDVQKADNVSPQIVAANIDNEAMILGEPTAITVTDNVELVAAVQAPPKHWDIISWDVASGGTSAGERVIDVFARLGGYNTTFDSYSSNETIKITGTSENWSVGGGGGFSLSKVHFFKENTPLFNISAKYTYDEVEKNTSSETMSATLSQMTAAAGDDQVYYIANDYTIWRYPVLFPADQRTEVVTGDDGHSETVQKFVQYVVPEKIGSSGLSTPGRNIGWYEPEHDTYNLFTYPTDIESMKNYPKGPGAKSPEDPWRDKNGVVISKAAKQLIGNADVTNFKLTISETISQETMASLQHTAGGNASGGLGGGLVLAKAVTLNMAGDYSFQSSTTSKANASQVSGATVNWPGGSGYQNHGGFSREDQLFYSDIAIFTQDAGAFNVAYAVSALKNQYSDLWGPNSPYTKHPDPGFILPNRFASDGRLNQKSDALTVRGLSFDSPAYDYNISGADGRAFPLNTAVTGKLRVVNHSFVDTQPFSVEISYQPTDLVSGYVGGPDPAQASLIATVPVGSVPGREKMPDRDNWSDIEFQWTTGSDVGVGYLHFNIVYGTTELNVANNRGYALVGIYNPDNMGTLARSENPARAVDADLSIRSVTARRSNGETIADLEALPLDEELEIECSVRLSSGGNAKIKALPVVRVLLFANDSLAGGKYTPVLPMDQEWTFHFNYDPAIHKDLVKLKELKLVATSPFLTAYGDADSSNNVYKMAFVDGTESPEYSDSSGGGCATGTFAAWFLPFISVAALRRGKRGNSSR